MSLFTKSVKGPDPTPAANTAQAQDALDQERRNRAKAGGRGASFLWDADPISGGAAKPTLTGSGG